MGTVDSSPSPQESAFALSPSFSHADSIYSTFSEADQLPMWTTSTMVIPMCPIISVPGHRTELRTTADVTSSTSSKDAVFASGASKEES